MTMIQDIDMAILNRSLKLLHSSDEDSAEQLKNILEETIKHKYGNRKPINLNSLGMNRKSIVEDNSKNKRLKLEDSLPTVFPIEDSQSSSSDSGDGVALEILDDDLSCVVCHDMAVGAGNNLVECLECHSLYHQECHSPPITQDVDDPRFVWYCATCTNTMNKLQGSSSSKGSPSNNGQSSKSSKPSSKSSNSTKGFPAFSSSGKSSSSSSNSSKHGSSSQHSKSSSVPLPKINTISADKRLQIMKKNAAKKQEKRKMNKL